RAQRFCRKVEVMPALLQDRVQRQTCPHSACKRRSSAIYDCHSTPASGTQHLEPSTFWSATLTPLSPDPRVLHVLVIELRPCRHSVTARSVRSTAACPTSLRSPSKQDVD